MSTGSLYHFNPHNTALYEARLWKAYYDRAWLPALVLLVRLLRSQFSLGPLRALYAAYVVTRAARTFAPEEHDEPAVLRLLQRFYAVVLRGTDGRFDPDVVGAAELDYWVVHRRLAGQKGTPALIESLATLAARTFGLPVERVRPSAVERARACDLVDDITGGRQAPTRAAWTAIEQALRRSYTLLHRELTSQARPI